MPKCNGPDAARAIILYMNENAPMIARPFICCVTSYNSPSFKETALEAGMDFFAAKFESVKDLKIILH